MHQILRYSTLIFRNENEKPFDNKNVANFSLISDFTLRFSQIFPKFEKTQICALHKKLSRVFHSICEET